MWLFGKRINVRKVARDEDTDEDTTDEELPSFAPKLIIDSPEEAAPVLPSFEEEPSVRAYSSHGEEDPSGRRTPTQPSEDMNEEKMRARMQSTGDSDRNGEILTDAPADMDALIGQSGGDGDDGCGEKPEEIYEHLKTLPLSSRLYALYDGRVLPAHSDGNGGLYLFDENGEYILASSGECKAFARLTGLSGIFRGRLYSTTDFEYIMKERQWPLRAAARSKTAYEEYVEQGFEPCGRTSDGRGLALSKSVSFFRMKDVCLRTELTLPGHMPGQFAGSRSESYVFGLPRAILEEMSDEKQFRKLCKTVMERAGEQTGELFFTVQVLKVRRNLAVCFPLEGMPQAGDHFAGGTVNAVAPAGDGTVIVQVGQDQSVKLPLSEGETEKGQRRLTL